MRDKNNRKCSIEGCGDKLLCRGLCNKHYKRWQTYGDSMHSKTDEFRKKQIEFLEGLISDPPDSCVLWIGTRDPSGYGRNNIDGSGTIAVHRYVLQQYTGINGDGLDACHGPCHNTSCINPKHLYWGTRSKNQSDRVRDGTDNRGTKHHANKLSEDEVLKIRASDLSNRKVGKMFNVSEKTVRDIKSRVTWSWL